MALCKVCGSTDDSLFYASIKTYCKEHWKEKVRNNRAEKIEYYRSFDRLRSSVPHRVKARKEYSLTEQGKIAHKRAAAQWIAKNPLRRKAEILVGNAIKRGKLIKTPCFACGDLNVEAHHPDYSAPLDVVWLCVDHHKEIHWGMEQGAIR